MAKRISSEQANNIIIKTVAGMISSNMQLIVITLMVNIGILLTHAEVCPAAEKKEWTYRRDHSNGPQHWGEKHPGCNGHQQSPINIITNKVMGTEQPQLLMLRNFDIPVTEVSIDNAGQFFTITPKDGVNRSLVLDGNEYPFKGFHFHFGNIADDGGSEHTIDGKRFPMEAHFLFLFPDNTPIQVSSLFELNNEINSAVNNILSVKSSYKYEGGKFEGKIDKKNRNPRRQGTIYLDDILDLNCPYYRYTGSDAIPPCPEGVLLLICKTHKYVKYSQLQRLFTCDTVTEEEDVQKDCMMMNNNRPLQESNDRSVYG